MSDAQLPFKPPLVETVQIAGDQLVAVVIEGDGVAVPLRMMCESIGVSTDFQLKQLREHPVLSSGIRMVNVSIGNRVRSVAALLHTYIPAWLNSISPNLVNEETRPKLLRFQEEVVDILARIYVGAPTQPLVPTTDVAILALQQQQQALINEVRALREQIRAEQERSVQRDQRLADVTDIVAELHDIIPIGPKEAAYIQTAIKRIAQRSAQRRSSNQNQTNLYELIFGQFKAYFHIPRYDALPRRRYDDALRWLEMKAQEMSPDDTDALPPRQERLL